MPKVVIDFLTPKSRQVLYVIFGIIGATLGATSVGFGAADLANPVWLNVAQEVFMFLAVGFGFVASTSVTPDYQGNVEV